MLLRKLNVIRDERNPVYIEKYKAEGYEEYSPAAASGEEEEPKPGGEDPSGEEEPKPDVEPSGGEEPKPDTNSKPAAKRTKSPVNP